MARDLAIILNSGSVNSAVATTLAVQKHRAILLHAEVAPQPASRRRAAYDLQVQHYKPYREHALPMAFLAQLQPGANNAATMLTAADPRAAAAAPAAPATPQVLGLLPLIAAAARYAVHYNATAIYVGLRVGPQGDELARATEYLQIWNELLQMPCGQPELEVVAPLLELESWQVVDVGYQVNAPLDRTWSCAEESIEPCWSCRGCRAREAAFVQSGKPDPLRAARKV
jgi:7-cyano-7-deazaguanine synthase